MSDSKPVAEIIKATPDELKVGDRVSWHSENGHYEKKFGARHGTVKSIKNGTVEVLFDPRPGVRREDLGRFPPAWFKSARAWLVLENEEEI